MHYWCYQISKFPFWCVLGFAHLALLDDSCQFVLFTTRMAGRGLFLFFCERWAFYKHCSTLLSCTTWRAGRPDWGEHQHTAKKFPLSRSDVRTI